MERKHRSQMDQSEIVFVETIIHSLSGWALEAGLRHASQRGRSFTSKQVLTALETGEVIEVNSYGRILMRDRKGTCVVVSVRDRSAVTVWCNNPNDRHKTLRKGEYTWRVNVIEYIKSLRGVR